MDAGSVLLKTNVKDDVRDHQVPDRALDLDLDLADVDPGPGPGK